MLRLGARKVTLTFAAAIGTSVVVALGTAGSSGTAEAAATGSIQAQTVHHLAPSSNPGGLGNGPWYFCPKNQTTISECIISNGAGNQMTIHSSGYAALTFASVGSGYYTLKNAAGHCVYETSGKRVQLRSGGCLGVKDEEWSWKYDDTGFFFKNKGRGNILVTDGTVDGFKVWGGTTSQYWHWYLCNSTKCYF